MGLGIFLRAALFLAIASAAGAEQPPRAIEFNRNVRPILADHCFQCHGPDAKQRKADLRLDMPEPGNSKREGGPVIVAGHPEKSELWRRITSTIRTSECRRPVRASDYQRRKLRR